MDSSRNNLPNIIKTYFDNTANNTYVLGKYDIPVPSNHILITSYNGLLTPSNNITISSINVSSINGISPSILLGQNNFHDTFESDLIVSLPTGKTFGKYQSGQIIPATGKTAKEIIFDAIKQLQDPTPSLSFNPSIIPFNSSSVPIQITILYGINNFGATIQSETLNFIDVDNTITNLLITNSTNDQATSVHNIILSSFRTQPLKYQYYIKDTDNSYAIITSSVTIASYLPPTIALSINTVDREIGDILTHITGIITKQSTNVPLSSYKIDFMYNDNITTYSDIQNVNITNDTSIQQFTHNPTELINTTNNTYPNSITYRLQVIDSYLQQQNSFLSQTYTINFYPYIYYGSFLDISSIVTSGNSILSDGSNIDINKIKTLLKNFNNITGLTINTGTTNNVFVIALPISKILTSVYDVDAYNTNIISSFNVYNKIITTTNNNINLDYNIYIYTIAFPYSFNHILDILIN